MDQNNANMRKVYVSESRFGRGVFAAQKINADQVILRLSGPIITFDDVLKKGRYSMNALQIGRGIYIDLDEPGVLVNHSCNPNAGVSRHLELIAIRDIEIGDEIFYDYSTVMNEDLETMECQCGSLNCRRTIGDFRELPSHVQGQYLNMGVVAPFIIDDMYFEENRLAG